MQTINEARAIIDKVSQNLAESLAHTTKIKDESQINIISTAANHARALIEKGSVPKDFLDMIYVVSERLSQYAEENKVTYENELLEDVVGDLSLRYNALAPIVLDKDRNGLKSSYVKERHNAVIIEAGNRAIECGSDVALCKDIAKILANRAVALQDQYLQDHSGPLAEIING